jgi:hypothetical protein
VRCRVLLNTAAMSDPKLRITIQSSTGLNVWNNLTARTGGGAWTGLLPQFAIPAGANTTLTFQTTTTPEFTPRYFLRLKAEELP